MFIKTNKQRAGFTLVEIMIVVAIIALLAAIAVPNFMRARLRSQATTTLETLRLIDQAKDQYAIENNKSDDVVPSCFDLVPYAKPGSMAASQLAANHIGDAFGHDIAINAIGESPAIENATWDAFAPVVGDPATFWSPFRHY